MSFAALNLPSTRFPRPWPLGAEIRSYFGQNVLWLDYSKVGRHLSADVLEDYRHVGDPELDTVLQAYEEEGRSVRAGEDLLERPAASPPSQGDCMREAWLHKHAQLPSWVDVEQLKRGQTVFLAYAPALGASLYYRSLCPGFSIPKIAKVLLATAYLAPPSSPEQVECRLVDTGAMLALCFTSDNIQALLPNGAGWKATLQVRVLHAKVRHRLLQRPGALAWQTAEYGVPLNQEDMAATLLAFSANALLGAEMILGGPLPRAERLAYLHVWRYLGWLLGVPTVVDGDMVQNNCRLRPLDPCGPGWLSTPDPIQHSYAVFQSIILHILHPDATSVEIAHHLLRIGRRQATKEGKTKADRNNVVWFYFRCLQCRRFIGDPLADALELPRHPVWHHRGWLYLASTVYLCLLRVYTMAALPWSPLRSRIVAYHDGKMRAFVAYWRSSHLGRMRRGTNDDSGGACPFAMVAPPREE